MKRTESSGFFWKNIGIKWKIFGYFLLFAVLLLGILWAYQTFFLETFYKNVKTNTLVNVCDDIYDNIDSSDLQTKIDTYAKKSDIGIRITDFYFNDIYKDNITYNSIAHRLRKSELFVIYQKAIENNGNAFQSYQFSVAPPTLQDILGNDENFTRGEPESFSNKGILQDLLYAKLVTREDGSIAMILVDTIVTPLDSTVKTLSMQLIRISGIMIVIALILAFTVSKIISTPIEVINKASKKLALGEYDTKFNCHGYKEISQLNETLLNTASELKKVEKLRHELIANVSHDLRTPLTMIVGYGEIIRDIPGENSPENVQVIIDEAQRLTTLVNALLDISKLQSGISGLEYSKYNFTESIREIIDRYIKMLENNGFNINFISNEDVFVNADQTKITQVVYNLLNNAINYSGDSKTIKICQTVIKDKVRLEIEDSGEGIPEEAIPYIWDRYYKVDKIHKRSVVGSGLGLSIVKSILELHGAKYGVFSTVGIGSTFWFEITVI